MYIIGSQDVHYQMPTLWEKDRTGGCMAGAVCILVPCQYVTKGYAKQTRGWAVGHLSTGGVYALTELLPGSRPFLFTMRFASMGKREDCLLAWCALAVVERCACDVEKGGPLLGQGAMVGRGSFFMVPCCG